MNFFFRTNFNKKIGLGHLFRVLRIYNELKKNIIVKYLQTIMTHLSRTLLKKVYFKNYTKIRILKTKSLMPRYFLKKSKTIKNQ